ncbi:MAG: zf-HC2 domain-containing protein [Planctomycetes bacterium]|nr:zf-HC2 domain-containing protein [Planctomycetota bacterium]
MGWRCFIVRKQLALFVGDDLSDSQKRTVQSHLELCPSCRLHYAALQRVREVMVQCGEENSQFGPSLWPSLRNRLEPAEFSRPVQPAWLPLGALAAASVAIAVMLWDHRGAPAPSLSVLRGSSDLTAGQALMTNQSDYGGVSASPWPADRVGQSIPARAQFLLEQAHPFGHAPAEF